MWLRRITSPQTLQKADHHIQHCIGCEQFGRAIPGCKREQRFFEAAFFNCDVSPFAETDSGTQSLTRRDSRVIQLRVLEGKPISSIGSRVETRRGIWFHGHLVVTLNTQTRGVEPHRRASRTAAATTDEDRRLHARESPSGQ